MDWKWVYSCSAVSDHCKRGKLERKKDTGEKINITTLCDFSDVWVIVVCGFDAVGVHQR